MHSHSTAQLLQPGLCLIARQHSCSYERGSPTCLLLCAKMHMCQDCYQLTLVVNAGVKPKRADLLLLGLCVCVCVYGCACAQQLIHWLWTASSTIVVSTGCKGMPPQDFSSVGGRVLQAACQSCRQCVDDSLLALYCNSKLSASGCIRCSIGRSSSGCTVGHDHLGC